jgi:ribose transport system substrate-binding protein
MKLRLACFCLAAAVAAHAQTFRIALVTKGDSNEYWKTVHAGAVKAQKDLATDGIHVDLEWAAPPTESSDADEIRLVDGFVARKVNGLVLSPTNMNALCPPVQAAFQAGIPTVVIDSGLNDASQISFVATDNYNGGLVAARRVGSLLGGKGRVIVFRFLKYSAGTRARESGFIDTIQNQFPDIQVIDVGAYAGATYGQAHDSAAALLRAQAVAGDAIFCSNEISAVGMLKAVREGLLGAGKVKLVVFDSSTATLDGLKAGDIQGIVVQDPLMIGYTGVQTLVSHLLGRTVEENIDTGCRLVTLDNIATPDIAALIHPPVDQYAE